jgi:superfamily II DNA or RNA helicase
MVNKREQIQKEALDVAIKHKRCSLGISMGVGKTLIGLNYIHYLQVTIKEDLKVLVVAPKLSIFDTWKSDAEKFNIDIEDIEFTTYLSINKKNPRIYDLVVLDECHNLLDTHDPFLSKYSGRVLGLTGTPPRYNHSEKGRMVMKYCPVLYKYITDDAIDDAILNDYRILIHHLPLNSNKTHKMETKGKTWYTSERDSYNYWSRRVTEATTPKSKQISSVLRMKVMMEFKSKEEYAKKLLKTITNKCIVFANTIAQARRLCEFTYDSENPDSESNLHQFSHGEVEELACVLQLSEGINIPNLKEGIILHAYGNERKSSQRIGRLLRLNPNDKSTVHILCFDKTVDEKWINQALQDFDQTKITHIKENESVLNF